MAYVSRHSRSRARERVRAAPGALRHTARVTTPPVRPTPPDAVPREPPDGATTTTTPAPPWPCRVEATLWWHRATPAALDTLPPALRARVRLPVTVGAFLRYPDSPVGPYEEVLACPAILDGGRGPGLLHASVPFIAVDSAASVSGGREHWDLPKVLATFRRQGPRVSAAADGWAVTATVRAFGPPLPVAAWFRVTQPGPGGGTRTARSRVRGLARPARVLVEVDPADPLSAWVVPGRHPGARLTRARLLVGPASRGDAPNPASASSHD